MLLKQSTTRNLSVFITQSADHVSGLTGATLTINASKDGAAFASITPTVTELANGWYSLALTTTHTNTLGDLVLHITATSADPTDTVHQVVSLLPGDNVTVGTNSDKTGYSLSQAFPTNFASLAITVGGAVTVGTNSDKTGYSLSQSFPANFSALAITVGGAVTVGTNLDKTGYSLTQTFPANFSALGISAAGNASVDLKKINGTTVNGDGSATPWGP